MDRDCQGRKEQIPQYHRRGDQTQVKGEAEEGEEGKAVIEMIPNMQWAHDVMTGQKSFPTFNRKGEDKGFKELFEKEMKKRQNDRSEGGEYDKRRSVIVP